MTDMELLERAAKAAGLTVLRCRLDDPMWRDMLLDMRPAFPQTAGWNPLEDDGEALRLAVRLDMGIEVMRCLREVRVGNGQQDPVTERWERWGYKGGQDELGATRRAIVLAAAALAP